jgi:hypothetical protein
MASSPNGVGRSAVVLPDLQELRPFECSLIVQLASQLLTNQPTKPVKAAVAVCSASQRQLDQAANTSTGVFNPVAAPAATAQPVRAASVSGWPHISRNFPP